MGFGSSQRSPSLPLLPLAKTKGAGDHRKAAQTTNQFDGYLPFTEHLHGVAQIPLYRGTKASEGAIQEKKEKKSQRMVSLRDGAGNLALAVDQSRNHPAMCRPGSPQCVDLGKAPSRPQRC